MIHIIGMTGGSLLTAWTLGWPPAAIGVTVGIFVGSAYVTFIQWVVE